MSTLSFPRVGFRDDRDDGIPPLHNGDRLMQAEFHRRYLAMPEHMRAELIGGIVYMASPLRLRHGRFHMLLGSLLMRYEDETPGVEAADNVTVILDEEAEPQPDLHMRILPEFGGRSHADESDYLVGPPDLIVEIAHSSEAIDLHAKRLDYERTGVREYVVALIRSQTIRVFDLASGKEQMLDADGIVRSKAFPGLWIDSEAFWTRNKRRLQSVLRQGLKSAEHATFVRQMKDKIARRSKSSESERSRPRSSRNRGPAK
jgi:Uma2 family endonuclease